jgi:hypothetical protein
VAGGGSGSKFSKLPADAKTQCDKFIKEDGLFLEKGETAEKDLAKARERYATAYLENEMKPKSSGPRPPPAPRKSRPSAAAGTGTGAERNLKLHVPEEAKDPNFYRWVNNKPGRVKQLTQMDDYDIVSSADGDRRRHIGGNGRQANRGPQRGR